MKKKTHEKFIEEIYNLVGTEYTIIGQYQKSNRDVLIKHNVCNNEYPVKPNNFLRGKRCPKCNGTPKKDTIQFKSEIFKKYGTQYIILEEYINNETKIKVKHINCDFECPVKPVHLLAGHSCPKCAGVAKKNTEIFKQEIIKLFKNEYIVIGKYQGANKPIKIKHNNCGNIFKTYPTNMLSAHGCPECKSSKGENRINNYLKILNLQKLIKRYSNT